jgi:prepilin-type N-terminal cleavage/methylation domain-containing protein
MTAMRATIALPRAAVRAFTLVELLVVITIIVVLVGIVLAVGAALGNSGAVTSTRNTLKILDNALAEWEQSSGRTLTWGVNGTPAGSTYDMQETTYHVYLISELLATIGRSNDVKSMLSQVSQNELVTYTNQAPEWVREEQHFGFPALEPDPQVGSWLGDFANWSGAQTVLDAWDRPIRFIHPGRKWTTGESWAADPDGTVQTPLEERYGSCRNGRGFFVSGGPDGAFGDWSTTPEDDPRHQAVHDNIFTIQPEHS